MKTETKYFFMKAIAGCFTLGFIVFLLFFFAPGAKAEDNKTIEFDDRGWPKILDEDEWRSQLIFDTVQACYQGTIRWVLLSNPALLNQIPSPLAQRQMMEHCFCVMDKIRKENKVKDYSKKVLNPEWGGNLFMLKAMECVKEYETLPSFFMKMPNDNETKKENKIKPKEKQIPDNSSSSKDEESLADQKQKEFQEESPLIFQG